jgi:hypothetical protein
MKNTWRILGAVAALTLGACTGGGDGGENGNGGGTGSCTGTFSGAVTANVGTCSVSAVKIPSTGQLQFTIKLTPATGTSITRASNVILTVLGDAKTATYSGADFKEGLGTIETASTDYELQIITGSQTLGSATLTIDSVPAGTPVGDRTNYESFGGNAQIKFVPTSGTGEVNLALTFKRS